MKQLRMKINKTHIIIILFCTAQLYSFGQVQQNYSLNDIIKLGLQQSHQLKISTSQQRIDHLTVNEAKMAYTPGLSVSGQAMLLNQPRISFQGNNMAGFSNPSSAAFVMGSLSVPIFNGFQLVNNLKAAKEMELSGNEKVNLDSTTVILQLINTYVALYKAEKAEELINENLENANQRVNDFEKLKKNGLLSENDYLKAQLQISKVELSLLDVDNQHQMAQYQLNTLAGLDEMLEFTVDSTIFYQNHLISDASTFQQVEEDRKDLQALLHQKEASNYLMKLQKNAYYPHINLTGTYLSMNVPNTFSVYNMLNAGVSLSYDLSSFYKKNPTIAKVKQQFLQVDEQTKILTEKIKLELHQAFLDYQKATRQVEVYNKTVLQASENYKDIKSKHDNNLVTTTDLLDADLELLQAKINQQLAQADMFLAYCNYLKTTGNLDELRKLN